ncbi:hypothetical protein [Methylobacterium brachiatum]
MIGDGPDRLGSPRDDGPSCSSAMDAGEFKARLHLLNRTQAQFAAEIGCTRRTVSIWASKGPPTHIAYLLDLLTVLELPFGSSVQSWQQNAESESVSKTLDRLMSDESDPELRMAFLLQVHEWLQTYIPDPRREICTKL